MIMLFFWYSLCLRLRLHLPHILSLQGPLEKGFSVLVPCIPNQLIGLQRDSVQHLSFLSARDRQRSYTECNCSPTVSTYQLKRPSIPFLDQSCFIVFCVLYSQNTYLVLLCCKQPCMYYSALTVRYKWHRSSFLFLSTISSIFSPFFNPSSSILIFILDLHFLKLNYFTMMNPLSPNSTIALLSILNVFTYSTIVFLFATFAPPKIYWVLVMGVFLSYALEIQEVYHVGVACKWPLQCQQRVLCLVAETAYFSLAVNLIYLTAINIWERVSCTLKLDR